MGSIIGFGNRTQSNSHTNFLVRLCSISELIEPNRSIKSDWVRLSSISYVGLEDISEAEVKAEFRFAPSQIDLLSQALRIPGTFTCSNGTVASGEEGLLMLLKRFAYPCRLTDMIPRFGRSAPEISLILAEVTDHIVNFQGHLLQDLDQPWLQPQYLEEFARAIHQKGAALDNCWGFVDGTIRPICRPGGHQRLMFNGHKRVHCLKFQSVVAPNGMIANLFGPVGELICDLISV